MKDLTRFQVPKRHQLLFLRDPLWKRSISPILKTAGVLCLILLILMVVRESNIKQRLEVIKLSATKYSGMLASCMNGGVLWDTLAGKAYFCDKVIGIQLEDRRK